MVVIVEIVIHEEIGVTPLVCLEHLKGQGHKLTVAAKIVKQLGVGLGLALAAREHKAHEQQGGHDNLSGLIHVLKKCLLLLVHLSLVFACGALVYKIDNRLIGNARVGGQANLTSATV